MIDLDRIPKEISRILESEQYYNHMGFTYGLSDINEICEKYTYVSDLLQIIQDEEELSQYCSEAKEVLKEMIGSRLLTPESLAIIMSDLGSNDKVSTFIKQILEEDCLSSAIFDGVYYKQALNDFVRSSDELLSHYKSLEKQIQKVEYINEKFKNRYINESICKWFSGKGAVYTVITGDYDDLHDPLVVFPDWDYYCFTDRPEKYQSDIWSIKELSNPNGLDNVHLQRYMKMHPFELLHEYDYTIYVDAKVLIKGDLNGFINSFSRECSMLCFLHPTRNTLQEEVDAIYSFGKADLNKMISQIEYYSSQGYIDQIPLIDSCVLVRSNNDVKLNRVMEDWWYEIQHRTHRDQLSIGYCCWKNDYNFDVTNLLLSNNPYISIMNHK